MVMPATKWWLCLGGKWYDWGKVIFMTLGKWYLWLGESDSYAWGIRHDIQQIQMHSCDVYAYMHVCTCGYTCSPKPSYILSHIWSNTKHKFRLLWFAKEFVVTKRPSTAFSSTSLHTTGKQFKLVKETISYYANWIILCKYVDGYQEEAIFQKSWGGFPAWAFSEAISCLHESVCMCISMYTWMYTCMCVDSCEWLSRQGNRWALRLLSLRMHVCMDVCMHAYMQVSTHTQMHTHTDTCNIASGVTSRADGPVPPVKHTKQQYIYIYIY